MRLPPLFSPSPSRNLSQQGILCDLATVTVKNVWSVRVTFGAVRFLGSVEGDKLLLRPFIRQLHRPHLRRRVLVNERHLVRLAHVHLVNVVKRNRTSRSTFATGEP